MKNLVDIKPGDRFRYSSPIWKEIVVEFVEGNSFVCRTAIREPFVYQGWITKWSEGNCYSMSQINLKLWEKIDKSSNFNSLYEKLQGE